MSIIPCTPITIGSISHGTMRPQDLIPCFLEVLNAYGARSYDLVISLVAALDNDSAWWDSDAASDLLYDVLYDALYALAPAGHYFGNHPGDESDFGFWPVED